MKYKTLDVPMSSITDVKKSPSEIFKVAETEGPVYVLNRNKPEGVVMTPNQYEKLLEHIEELEEKIFEQEILSRLQDPSESYISSEEAFGEDYDESITFDENDGWE